MKIIEIEPEKLPHGSQSHPLQVFLDTVTIVF